MLQPHLTTIAGQANRFAVVDCEMTGFGPETQHLIEVAIIQLDLNGDVIDVWESLICSPDGSAGDEQTQQVHHITDAMLVDAPTFSEIAGDIAQRLDGACLVGYGISFDIAFLRVAPGGPNYRFKNGKSLEVGRACQMKFDQAIAHHNVEIQNRHSALGDAAATASLFFKLLDYWIQRGKSYRPCTMTTSAKPGQHDLWKPRGGYDPADDLAAAKLQAEAALTQTR